MHCTRRLRNFWLAVLTVVLNYAVCVCIAYIVAERYVVGRQR